MYKHTLYILITLLFCTIFPMQAEQRGYFCEFGVQGGMGYYTGDATPHIFHHIQPAAGAQFRYKFTSHWALQVKGQWQQYKYPQWTDEVLKLEGIYPAVMQSNSLETNQLVSIDAVAEFNFLRFGATQYDTRVHPFTPYIFMGIGVGMYSNFAQVGAYFPFGIGFKWKFAKRFGLNFAWQHQLFFADNLENLDHYNNTLHLNGSDILNNDLTSTLTLGIVFEFARDRGQCRHCND